PDEALGVEPNDERVAERRALTVGSGDAVGPRDGALDAHGGVAIDEALHVVGDVRRVGPTGLNRSGIHGYTSHARPRAAAGRRRQLGRTPAHNRRGPSPTPC